MRAGARIAAAIDVLNDVATRKRPAADALKDWGLSHRFAGRGDRSAIGDIVFGALRWKASSAWRMGEDTPRDWTFGALRWGFGWSLEAIETAGQDAYAPAPLNDDERARLAGGDIDAAPAHVRGDYPEWLDESLQRAFGDARADEGASLAAPAPLDLRANALKCDRAALIEALNKSDRLRDASARETTHAPDGVRIDWTFGRAFAWMTEQSFVKGWFEVQDEGSQLAALATAAEPGMQVVDVCAGGGGKTLALAAMMQNKGQIYAFDVDGARLAPLKARLDRAGARNVQIRAPERGADVLQSLQGKMDLALVDAPCTGSGTWRRAPDAKWRLRPNALQKRQHEQHEALALAAPLVKPGGLLAYITCSVLPEENEDQARAFLAANKDYVAAPFAIGAPHHARAIGVQLTPRLTGCDGFYVALLRRRDAPA